MPSKDSSRNSSTSNIELELYYLIAQFLKHGPCQEAGSVLINELEKNGLLHRSLDWTGSPRPPDYTRSISRFRDLPPDYLLKLCQRIGPVLDVTLPPPVSSRPSLCGLGSYSVLRDHNAVATTTWNSRTYSASIGHNPVIPPRNFNPTQNWSYSIFGREHGGSKYKNLLRPIKTLYGQMKLHRRILGHLSSVYCILFDRTGMRIFTGSDDCLIKSWSSSQGRLLATFRGHQSEICDMDISYENTLLASASCDKEIRIWDTRNGKPITILQSHSAMITSVEFNPMVQGDTRYLVSTGRDGNVVFWTWNVHTLDFDPQPHKFQERNRPGVAMLCSSCSSGGRFIAVGGSDNLVHIYHIPFEHEGDAAIGPLTIAEQDEHRNTVDSIWFSHDGLRLVSGSKDGTARVWTFECSTWMSVVLDVARTHGSPLDPVQSVSDNNDASTSRPSGSSKSQGKDTASKICVIMVAWDCCDENVMTSLTNYTIKVWNSNTRALVSILKGHTDEAYCLEPHPSDRRVLLSAGHDGNVFLWDVITGNTLMNFHNMLEGLGHGAVFDAKFSRDGNSFACTDSHGHLLIFGFGDGNSYQKSPVQQFFHTDYRPLIRDQHGYVLDEQTQQAPYLMPPPFLVDMDGNPYPPELQRLVPGREHSNDSQLLPNLVMQEDDAFQVIDVENIPEEPQPELRSHSRSALDDRIQEMLQQGNADESDEGDGLVQAEEPPPFASPSSSVGLRREGDTAGVRQMHPNAPRSQVASVADIMALKRRVITPQFSQEEHIHKNSIRKKKGIAELQWYRRERKKRRPVSHRRLSRDQPNQHSKEQELRRGQRKRRNCVITRFKEEPEEEEEQTDGERNRELRRRLMNRGPSHAHRYSTRSTVPRRRLSSVAESNQDENMETGIEEVEEQSFSEAEETSSDSSSEEDFSQKAKIIRRSQRNDRNKHRKEKRRKNKSLRPMSNGLRRSQRQRRIPKRLENSEHDDSSDHGSNDEDAVDTTPDSKSIFLAPRTRQHMRVQNDIDSRKIKTRAQRLTSIASVESSDAEGIVSPNSDIPTTSSKWRDTKVQLNGEATSKIDVSVVKSEPKDIKTEVSNVLPIPLTPGQPPPECYLPPEWIRRVTPCNFPYVPQISDEVVYIRQGHEMYVQKVRENHVWSIGDTDLCYKKYPDIGLAELCLVVNIEYKVGPPTLCEIQLQRINQKISKKSTFSVRYHDMPNVVDFLILKDKYDISVARTWSSNDAFRSIIDDTWWYGTVMEKKPINPIYPQSHFQEVTVLWDGENGQGDIDYLSPWDMEPIPELPNGIVTRSRDSRENNVKGHVRVDPKELLESISYRLKQSDWKSRDDSDSDDDDVSLQENMVCECQRIAQGVQQLILDGQFDAFVNPVDIVEYPAYPFYVAFPTDLSLILQRVKNYYYRRSSAICWEISQLEKNAIAFNEPESPIAKSAQLLNQVLTAFIGDPNCRDALDLQSHFQDGGNDAADSSFVEENSESDDAGKAGLLSSELEVESEVEADEPEISGHDSQEISEYATTAGEDEDAGSDLTWTEECKKLIQEVMQAQDSRPFRRRRQKDEDDLEDDVASDNDDDCMDLTTIEGKLLNNKYKHPEELGDDVQTMFTSFKSSNPSREGRSMLARLSPLMKSRIDLIVSVWKEKQSIKSPILTRRSSRMKSSVFTESITGILPQASSSNGTGCDNVAKVAAYPTRNMLKRQAKYQTHPKEESIRPRRTLRRQYTASQEDDCDGSEHESAGNEKDDEAGEYEVAMGGAVKRLSSNAEVGQGDAGLSLRLRKKRKMDVSHTKNINSDDYDTDGSSSGDGRKSEERHKILKTNGNSRSLARPPTFVKNHGHELRAKRNKPTRYEDYSEGDSESEHNFQQKRSSERKKPVRKSARVRKPVMKYNNQDSESDSDEYGDIVEADDLEQECPALSPEGYRLVPKKSARFRNGSFTGDNLCAKSLNFSQSSGRSALKRRISSHSTLSDSDER